MPSAADNPLLPAVKNWIAKINLALEFKGRRFGRDAAEGMAFYNGSYEFIYGRRRLREDRHFRETEDDADTTDIPPPRFNLTINKAAELVQIFGPALYHRNPHRQVNPREAPLPDDDLLAAFGADPAAGLQLQQLYQQGVTSQAVDRVRSRLLEHYLNYTPTALDLKSQARMAIDEAIIKGMGLLWQEVYTPPGGGRKMVGSFYDSVDNLVIDPDMPTLDSAKWVARRRVEPAWEVERKFGLPPGALKASLESLSRQAEVSTDPDGNYWRAAGQTNDLAVYWEVFSKTGVGGRLSGNYSHTPQAQALDLFGDHCYLAVCQNVDYPLNVPPGLWDVEAAAAEAEINRRLAWPTPFWADGAWPFAPIYFHTVPGDPWPLSHLAPGMGELKFLNWMYSYIAGKVRMTCRDFVAILKEADPEIADQIVHGTDLSILKVTGSNGKSIDQLVQFLQHPAWNNDIWKVAEAVTEQFEKRVGLTELIYGQTAKQIRSAGEAQIRSDQMNVRPDDMANKVEDAMTLAARQEALAVRYHLTADDVAPIMGPTGTAMWTMFIVPSNPAELLYQLEYRIEAGSIRKPNRERDAANAQQVFQTLLPFYQQVAMAGQVGPFNTAVETWCRANDIKSDGLLIAAPAPMTAPPPGGGSPPQ